MKKLLILPIFFILGSFSAQAAPACVNTGGILSIIKIDDIEYKTQCCNGLEVEKIGNDEVCFKKDDSPLDPTAQSCSSDSDCGGSSMPGAESTGKKGCFVQDPDDLFSGETNSDAEEESQTLAREAMDEKIETVLAALGEDADEKTNGQGCTYHAECESYNCVPKKSGNHYVKKCEEKKICRLAKIEEKALAPIGCEEGLIKDSASICRDPKDGTYLGLLGDIEIETDDANTCKMDLPEDAKIQGMAAIKALRSMEFLFAKTSVADHEDCLKIINPVLRDRIGKKLSEARKAEVKTFNDTWAQIKTDYQTIMAAQEADAATLSQAVQLHGESVPMDVIKSRTSTGFDMLIMMKRRNLLFMNYEKRMGEVTKEAFNEVAALGSSMRGFDQGSKKWNYTTADGHNHDYYKVSCRAWLFPRKKMKIKKRWGQNFQVWGRSEGIKELADNKVFISSLAQMADGSSTAAKDAVTARKYYLLDPLMPKAGGVRASFEDFGGRVSIRSKDRNRKLGKGGLWNNIFAGVVGGPLVWAILLDKPDADGGKTLYSIRNRMLLSYQHYLKEFNPENKQNYLYEPELVAITNNEVTRKEETDCIFNAKNIDTDQCVPMKSFIENNTDITLAQLFAFSRNGGRDYKNYFGNDHSWRNRLFRYYKVHYDNLVKYYGALERYRVKQNNCIDERLGLLDKTMMEGGYAAGLTNNYWDPNKYHEELNTKNPTGSARNKTNLSVNHNFSGFDGATNSVKNGGALKDNMATGNGTNTGAGSVGSAADASFAANVERMNAANKKNMSADELSQKSKDVINSMKETLAGNNSKNGSAASTASLGSGLGNGSSAFGNGLGGGSNAATLGNDLKGDADKNASDKNAGTGVASGSGSGASAAGSGSGFGNGGLGSITSGSSSGMGSSDASSGNGSGYQDPTGMSDEEKERLMANYERTKSKYNPNENDSLFNVVSKAYVRNLEKVLTKKKKTIEPIK